MTNLQILSHNIAYSYLGVDQNNVPVIQTSTLDIGKSLDAFETLLREFYTAHTSSPLFKGKISDLLTALSAEYQTIQSVLKHLAYSNQEFSPQLYGEEIYKPNIWAGLSYYRLINLTRWGACDAHNIEQAIRAVAAAEAQCVFRAACMAAQSATNLILIDSAAYHTLAGGEETV